MKNKHQNIKEELEELGIPLEHKPNTPLSVPSGYFDTFKQDMLQHVATLDFVDNLPKEMPQQLPVGYFEQSKSEILELTAALDFVENLPKEMPQQLPVSYFEQSKSEVLAKITSDENENRVNDFKVSRSVHRRNWALAASMALIVSIGLFFINSINSNVNLESELAQIPTEMIESYINEHDYDFEAFNILENPEIITKDIKSLEEQILNETKTLSNEEIFEYVL